MAITQSGTSYFDLSYPAPSPGVADFSNPSISFYTDGVVRIAVTLYVNTFNPAPPWQVQLGLQVQGVNDDGSGGAQIYSQFSIGDTSLDVGPHSFAMNVVDGDISAMIDDWQIDLSGAHAASRHGAPFLSYHTGQDLFKAGSLVGNTSFPYGSLLGNGEDVPFTCWPPSVGSITFGPPWPVGTWKLFTPTPGHEIGWRPAFYVGAGMNFWTERYLSIET